jgi:hypothetical protein
MSNDLGMRDALVQLGFEDENITAEVGKDLETVESVGDLLGNRKLDVAGHRGCAQQQALDGPVLRE